MNGGDACPRRTADGVGAAQDLAFSRNAEFSTSLSGGHHAVLLTTQSPVSAGCDTAYDGWVREGQTLGCYGKTACAGAPSQSRCGETRTLASVLLGLLRLHLYASIAMAHLKQPAVLGRQGVGRVQLSAHQRAERRGSPVSR